MHPATGFTMWTPPPQLHSTMLLQQSLATPNFDWKSRALYYAEKCEQLGTELGNVRHHLEASCTTVQSLLGNKRDDIDPLIVSVTLESHWQSKYVKAAAEKTVLFQQLEKARAYTSTLSAELERTMAYLNSLEQSFGVMRAEHEALTLELADHAREVQTMEDQTALNLTDIWAVSPPSSPTHLMPIPDGWDDMADIWTLAPGTGLPMHIMPIPAHPTCEVMLPASDQALHLHTVLNNMGYANTNREVSHIMACYCREYIRQHGHAPIPRFFYAPGDLPKYKHKYVKRLTLLSASDTPMLTRVICNNGIRRG